MTGNDNDISAIDGGVLRRSSAGKDGGPAMIAGRQGRGRGTRWMQGARCFIDTVSSFPGSNECRTA